MTSIDYTRQREVIRGPFLFFGASFKVEFLEPEPELNATVLIRASYIANHPLIKLGKNHPQAPPLHVHFYQFETFKILQGALGVTIGYEQKEVILTPENTPFDIGPMEPHAPYPHPELTAKGEDTVALMHLSARYDAGQTPDLLQISLSQHMADTPLVMLPKWTSLGPLRWWIPYVFQANIAWVASRLGYSPLIKDFLKDQ